MRHLILIPLLTACGQTNQIDYVPVPATSPAPVELSTNVVYISTNAGSECAYGGKVVTMAVDLNANGVLDADDSTFEHVTICYPKPPHKVKKGHKHD